ERNSKQPRGPPFAGHDGLEFGEYGTGPRFECDFRITSLPANIAFDVFARVGQQEYKIGSLCREKSSTETGTPKPPEMIVGYVKLWESPEEAPEPFTSCDLILRSSEEAARRTVDLFEIWKGELIYKNL